MEETRRQAANCAAPLPEASGADPFIVIAAIAGGWAESGVVNTHDLPICARLGLA
ncbi:MAG: hypothetical protein ABSD64_08710 [Terriglobales bacterium]|jgi:hypothetical protein